MEAKRAMKETVYRLALVMAAAAIIATPFTMIDPSVGALSFVGCCCFMWSITATVYDSSEDVDEVD
jgi:hypothetical protein